MSDIALFLVTFACSFAVSAVLWAATPMLLPSIRRVDLSAKQAAHSAPTLRLGGAGIFAALLLGAFLIRTTDTHLLLFVTASLPVLVSGLLEDLGHAQSARRRLFMASVSGAILIVATGLRVQDIGIWGVDLVFGFAPVAIVFTLFATVGMINAFNLVDGMNGMAGTAALVAATGLAALSAQAGVAVMDSPLPAICGALIGFLFINYPSGRIFLGDSGAYVIGFVLAWLAVLAMDRAPDLSPWAVVLVFFWPLADTILAMARRRRSGIGLHQPDRMHFHHLIMRLIEICVLGRRARNLSNPLATLVLLPLMVAPAFAGIRFWNNDLLAALVFGGFGALFVLTYRGGIWLARRHRKRPVTWSPHTPKHPIIRSQRG